MLQRIGEKGRVAIDGDSVSNVCPADLLLDVARLLLTYGAKMNEKDTDGWVPFKVNGHVEMMKLLYR